MEDGHRSTLGLEHSGELLVVVCHHGRLLGLLARRVGEQSLDVLDGSERLLPELELDGRVELLEPGLEVSGEHVRVGEVDGVGLVGVLVDGGEVLSDDLAQSSELGLSGVLDAELERLVDDRLVDDLESGRVSEDLETDSEALPEEPEGGEHNLSVRSVSLGVDRHEKKRGGLKGGVEVDLVLLLSGGVGGLGREQRRGGRLGSDNLGRGSSEELLDHMLDRGDVGRLSNVPVRVSESREEGDRQG